MNLNRGEDRVWRQRQNDEPLASSPEDQMIAAEEAKERKDHITRVLEEVKDTIDREIKEEESKKETPEGRNE